MKKLRKLRFTLKHREKFNESPEYWEHRYAKGGNSGAGSYGLLAEYKAEVLNQFVKQHSIHSVIEFGCGDGSQLALAKYPNYIGLDISVSAIRICQKKFSEDKSKSFFLYHSLALQDMHHLFSAELALSLDVIYHLIEDEIFQAYMTQLFEAATRYVIIYAWNVKGMQKVHVQHRKFSDWISENRKDFSLISNHIDIPKPSDACDFFIYKKN